MDNTAVNTRERETLILVEEKKREEKNNKWYDGFSQYVNECQLRGKVRESMNINK